MSAVPPIGPHNSRAAARPAGGRNWWPLAFIVTAIFLALIVAGTVIVFKILGTASRIVDSPGKIAASLASAFQPNVTVSTLLSSTIGNMHSHPKLVVLTTQIDAEVDKSSTTKWVGIDFGTTSVQVRAHGNKVQYYIPLGGLQTSNFIYDDDHKTLIVRVPLPVLDDEVVDVQSDPAKIEIETSNGWAKLDSFSGAPLRDEAKSELRTAVLAAARNDLLEHEAERQGKKVLRNFLQPITDALKPDIELDIEFPDK